MFALHFNRVVNSKLKLHLNVLVPPPLAKFMTFVVETATSYNTLHLL